MTIHISIYIFYYWLLAFVAESIYMFITFNQFKKANKRQWAELVSYKNMFKNAQSPSMRMAYKTITGPIGIVGFIIIVILSSPFTVITWLWRLCKKAAGYKTELETEVERELKAIEQEEKERQEWIERVEKEMQETSHGPKPEQQ